MTTSKQTTTNTHVLENTLHSLEQRLQGAEQESNPRTVHRRTTYMWRCRTSAEPVPGSSPPSEALKQPRSPLCSLIRTRCQLQGSKGSQRFQGWRSGLHRSPVETRPPFLQSATQTHQPPHLTYGSVSPLVGGGEAAEPHTRLLGNL